MLTGPKISLSKTPSVDRSPSLAPTPALEQPTVSATLGPETFISRASLYFRPLSQVLKPIASLPHLTLHYLSGLARRPLTGRIHTLEPL